MGGIGVLGLELQHPCLRLFASRNRFNAGDESALFDDEFVVGRAGEGERHCVKNTRRFEIFNRWLAV